MTATAADGSPAVAHRSFRFSRLRDRPRDRQDRHAGPSERRRGDRLHDHGHQRRPDRGPERRRDRRPAGRGQLPRRHRHLHRRRGRRDRHADVSARHHRGRDVATRSRSRSPIDPDLGGATSITNTASVTSDANESDPADNTFGLTHLVNELADVRVAKFCKPDTEPAPAGTAGSARSSSATTARRPRARSSWSTPTSATAPSRSVR